ncbi:hypothetical protein [Polycladidibacter stylochi]|uniref:hypothetical protein n=1 Tax=Polycladidibacter stylochi TaxID=1807766 RepID=UPI0012E3EB68|nr:hypothetical protein [Pseudovibrio stylochi]
MKTKIVNSKIISAVIVALSLSACASAVDSFDDGTQSTAKGETTGALMSFLVGKSGSQDKIDYKKRAPLVMPPDLSKLPEPDQRALVELATNWPVDQRAKKLKEIQDFYKTEDGKPLSPEQAKGHPALRAMKARQQKRDRDFAAERRQAQIADGEQLSPSEMRALQEKYRAAKAQIAKDQGDECAVDKEKCLPQRRYLTEPPLSYSAPEPGYPVGESEADKKAEAEKKREEQKIDQGKRIDMSKY